MVDLDDESDLDCPFKASFFVYFKIKLIKQEAPAATFMNLSLQ